MEALVLPMGFEPMTHGLKARYSTTELREYMVLRGGLEPTIERL